MKKVIAFVSVFSNAFNIHNDPDRYYYGNEGKYVEGKQTNEAPLKYLLDEFTKDKDIDEIICLVSKKAGEEPAKEMQEKQGSLSPYEYLVNNITEYENAKGKTIRFDKIDYSVSEANDFNDKIIPGILERVHPGDSILLETSGGPRINVIQMMFLARTLTYQHSELEGAVYSEYNRDKPNKLYNVTEYFRDFDLINGLNEFVSTGATDMLVNYVEKAFSSSDTVKNLVQAMNDLNKTIILGRITKIKNKIKKMKKKLAEAETELAENKNNQILNVLLPIFREKYEELSTMPEIIKWCAKNNLIQLAFTLYKDWIPEYIIKDAGIISLADIVPEEYTNNGDPIEPNLYYCIFYNEYIKAQSKQISRPIDYTDKDFYVKIIRNIQQLMRNNTHRFTYKTGITHSDMSELLKNYSYAAQFRNDLNHGIDSSESSNFIKQRRTFLGLEKNKDGSQKYIFDVDKLDIAFLKNFLIEAMDQLIDLAKR